MPIARASFLTNYTAIEQAEAMGIEKPEEEYEIDDFGFSLNDISAAHKASTGQIVIYISIRKFFLQWDRELYSAIMNNLASR